MSATELLETWRLLHPGARRRSSSLRALQERRLRAAAAHAYEQIPFYRELWDQHGFDPGSIRTVDDLRRLPIVTASAARAAAARGALLSRRARSAKWPVLYTSGSSGSPLAVACGPAERWLWWAFGMRISLEHGIRTRDAILRFDAHPSLPDPRRHARVSRTTWVSTALPLRQRLARFVETDAAVVFGTPTSLRQLCEAIATAGVPAPKPRVVFMQGEILDAATRRMVRSSLGVDPVSLYGLTEVGYVAWQCERREGFHVNAEAYLVEVLRDGRPAAPGEIGALVVTDVCSRARPLLRYETGDLAIASDGGCPCGRSLPIIASIEGRASDSALLPDGRVATTRAIVDGLAGELRPGDYRLHQEAPDRFRVMLANTALRDAVAPRLLSLLGDVELRIEAGVPSPRAGTDKTRVVSSAVPLRLSAPLPGA